MEHKVRRDLYMGANLRSLRYKLGLSQEKLCAEFQRRVILAEQPMQNTSSAN